MNLQHAGGDRLKGELEAACSNGDFGEFKRLLDEIKATHRDQELVQEPIYDGNRLFHHICKCGNADMAQELLARYRAQINPNEPNAVEGFTPLYLSCLAGNLPLTKVLLDLEERIDINQTTGYGDSPFSVACENGRFEIVQLLLERFGDKIDYKLTNDDERPPFNLACENGHLEIVSFLLERVPDKIGINDATENGETPLSNAIAFGREEIVRLLLDQLADELDFNQVDAEGNTLFDVACSFGQSTIVELLLTRFGEQIDVNRANSEGETPLLRACSMACSKVHSKDAAAEVVKMLLSNEMVDVDQANNEGITPLSIACKENQLLLVKWILATHPNVKIPQMSISNDEISNLLRVFAANREPVSLTLKKELGIGK